LGSRRRIARADELAGLRSWDTVLEGDMHRISDLRRRKPLGSRDSGARLGRTQPRDSFRIETVRATPVEGERAVREAANAEGGRLRDRAERRKLRRGPRCGALDRREELELGG